MKKIFVIFALILCNICFCIAQTITSETLITNVQTPYGGTVPDTYIITETPATAGDIEAAKKLVALYGGEYLGDPTWTYNCHAWAWHMSEGGTPSPVWIGWEYSTSHHIYWDSTNGGYVAVAENSATKVNYPSLCNHSAVRESQLVYVSKWGEGPLVRHAPYALPPQFNPQTYIYLGVNPGIFGYYAKMPLKFSLSFPSSVDPDVPFTCSLTSVSGIDKNNASSYSWTWYVKEASGWVVYASKSGLVSNNPPSATITLSSSVVYSGDRYLEMKCEGINYANGQSYTASTTKLKCMDCLF